MDRLEPQPGSVDSASPFASDMGPSSAKRLSKAIGFGTAASVIALRWQAEPVEERRQAVRRNARET